MTTPDSSATTPQMVTQIVKQVGGIVNADQVGQVLAAWNALREGDPIGTIRQCPDTKSIAHRVVVDGVHMWRISGPDGTIYNDLKPTLDWPKLS